MVGIVVLGHGHMAKGLVDTAEMIAGPQKQVASVSFTGDIDTSDYKDQVIACAGQVDSGEGVLFLVDLQGGTPCNMALLLSAESNSLVVTGVNIPMLVTVVLSRAGQDLEALAEMARQAGIEGIQNVKLQMEE